MITNPLFTHIDSLTSLSGRLAIHIDQYVDIQDLLNDGVCSDDNVSRRQLSNLSTEIEDLAQKIGAQIPKQQKSLLPVLAERIAESHSLIQQELPQPVQNLFKSFDNLANAVLYTKHYPFTARTFNHVSNAYLFVLNTLQGLQKYLTSQYHVGAQFFSEQYEELKEAVAARIKMLKNELAEPRLLDDPQTRQTLLEAVWKGLIILVSKLV